MTQIKQCEYHQALKKKKRKKKLKKKKGIKCSYPQDLKN